MKCSIVIPAKNQKDSLKLLLDEISYQQNYDFECIIVVDSYLDNSIDIVKDIRNRDPRFIYLVNDKKPGPAQALKLGIKAARGKNIITLMADGSDDATDIVKILELLNQGYSVVCASRYMQGGKQIGAKFFKSLVSRMVGLSFNIFTKVGTDDVTNNFKGYSREFIELVKVEAQHGFEVGIELVAKARRFNKPVAQIPTIWREINPNESNFRMVKWAPAYFKWYWYGLKKPVKNFKSTLK